VLEERDETWEQGEEVLWGEAFKARFDHILSESLWEVRNTKHLEERPNGSRIEG